MALVATLARTPEQAQRLAVDGRRSSSACSAAPSSRSPRPAGVLATLSLATPQAWFLRGLENLAGGAGRRASVLGPALAMLVVRGRHRRARARARSGGWSRDEGARDRRHGPAPAAALAGEHLLPLRPADADHPAARRRLRRLRQRRASASSSRRTGRSPRQLVAAPRRAPVDRPAPLRRASAACETAVARGDVDAGLVIPAGYDARLRAGQAGRPSRYLGRPDSRRAAAAGDGPVGRRRSGPRARRRPGSRARGED